ncbi:MAG: thioredoxin family protein [Verrucomicrobiales bacterium]|nr:thioredoxin family protein [Verrucomicrobiota bacterium JB025]
MNFLRLTPIAIALTLCSCDKAAKLISTVRQIQQKGKEQIGKTTQSATESTGQPVVHLAADALDSFHNQKNKVVVIDYYASWCGPCKSLAPVLEQLAAEDPSKLVVGKIDVEQHRQFAASQGVRGIPDVRIYRNGNLVDKFVGFPGPAEVSRRIKKQTELLAKTQPAATPTATPAAATANDPAATAAGEAETKAPLTQPYTKDWLPPGMERR